MNLLDDSSSDNETGGVDLLKNESPKLRINEQYARKFEYNKRQEELRRLEDKLGDASRKRKRPNTDDAAETSSEASSSTSSEDEDDAGELATETLDSEIQATLDAIRSKDPRVYDKNTTFYSALDTNPPRDGESGKPSKPVFLKDYHRQKLLDGDTEDDEGTSKEEPTYNQEQEALKKSVVDEINAAAATHASSDGEVSEGDFEFLAKQSDEHKTNKSKLVRLSEEDDDQDPETFLSNFMSSRAWVPTSESRFQPFESDDEEDERRAEEFEDAYNFRFEDPERMNEKLVSYARDANDRYSVRRSKETTRARRRETERMRKEAAKSERMEEKARLKRLRVDDLHDKVRKIRRAAGLKSNLIDDEDWAKLVNGDWDDSQWHTEMQRRFGDGYYADEDFDIGSDEADHDDSKRKPRKPKWDDEINIKDLVPDFQEQVDISSSDESGLDGGLALPSSNQLLSRKRRDKNKEQQRESRRDRKKIERLVGQQLELEPSLTVRPSKKDGIFRYRETSPVTFGLTHRDILMAEDRQLNQYAGIKKLATFRDADKKRKDRKRLGKKAHLQEWRKEVFGDKDGASTDFSTMPAPQAAGGTKVAKSIDDGVDIKEGKRKRKRPKRRQNAVEGQK